MQDMNNVDFKDTLSIIVPLHNKELNIENTINAIIKYINAQKLQILIIENGSTDSSKLIAQRTINKFKNEIDIVMFESQKGLGNALLEGFKHCKYKWIYFIPADFSFGNSEIEFIDKNNLYTRYDFFIGSKTHNDSIIERSRSRKLYSFVFNSLLKILFQIPFNDTQGTLVFKSNILNEISNLESFDFFITTEIVIKSFKKKIKILEVPVKDLGIQSKSTVKPFQDGLKMLVNIIKLRTKINL